MKTTGLIISLIFLINACSFTSSDKENANVNSGDDLEFAVDSPSENVISNDESKQNIASSESENSENVVDDSSLAKSDAVQEIAKEPVKEELKIEEIKIEETPKVANEGMEKDLVLPSEPKMNDFVSKPIEVAEEKIAQIEKSNYDEKNSNSLYEVQRGDTLMMIAFKIYGDYRKWKDLKKWNPGLSHTKFGPGMQIKYIAPESPFVWKPNGLPYLVKSGDTLGTISNDKYGTPKKWKVLYENNKKLILSPNLIFAGFTIYYVPTREVASKKE